MNLAEDFKFAADNTDELPTQAAVLRYVAAINIEATRDQFVAAAVAAGFAANSSANRFRESRHATLELARKCGENLTLNKDGSLTED